VRVCIALWNVCAYTIASLGKPVTASTTVCMFNVLIVTERNARANDKFMLQTDTLSTRQIDFIKSLVRLGSMAQISPPVPALAGFLRQLGGGEY